MNRPRLNKVVEYIRSHEEFPFNVEDVEEDLQDVLSFFNVFEVFSHEEQEELKRELRILALIEEESEVVRLICETGVEDWTDTQLVSSFEDKLRTDEACEVTENGKRK